MSNTTYTPNKSDLSRHKAAGKSYITSSTRTVLAAALATICAAAVPRTQAQTTVTIANPTPVIYGGAGVTAVYPGYTNALVNFTLTGGTDPVDLAVSVLGNPAGVTAGLVPSDLNPNNAANIITLMQVTGSTNVYLSASVVSAPKGSYQIEITASNTVSSVVVTNSTTVLVLPNLFTGASATDTNWSTDANWSLGAKPLAGDSARFQYASGATNAHFDSSIVLDSLQLMPQADNLFTTNYFAPGVTIAIKGPNGFVAGADRYVPSAQDGRLNFTLTGVGGSLVVTNPNAPFSMYNLINTGGGNRGTHDLGGLGNLYADVKIFGAGSAFTAYPRLPGTPTPPAENGVYALAMTNFIRATYVGDYSGSGTLMTNSIMFLNPGGNGNGNFTSLVLLGMTNAFFADSMSVLSHQSANASSVMRFNSLFIGGGNVPVAYFRGANGGRMTFFGVAVESGGSGGANGNQYTGRTRGSGIDFGGGRVDMLVDTLVLSQNQTNRNGNYTEGRITYTNGVINANVVRLGYRATSDYIPTIVTGVRPLLTVGGGGTVTEAILFINQSLRFMEGHFTETAAGSTFARLVINNGGKVYANSITFGTNNSGVANPAGGSYIQVNNGGQLTLTNTMCSLSEPMPQLTVGASGQLNFHVTAGQTNAFVTTLSDTAGAKINISSLTGFSPTVPATNVLIHYSTATGAGAHPISIGTVPAGYNNVTIFDNAVDQNIELRIQTNAPATLVWKGYVNNVWDHSTPNWLNPANNSQVAFFDADTVIFAETNSPNFKTINVVETVLPAASYMSNSASGYTFEGVGSIGGHPMTKQGSAGFTNNVINGSVLQLDGGALYGTIGGMGGVTMATNTFMYFGGSITAGLTVNSGAQATLLNGGTANGPVSVSGVMTNEGTIQGGSLSVNATGFLVNNTSGTLLNIGNTGSGNVANNATLLNVGNIGAPLQPNSLTINGTFKDMGLGTIYLTTLTLNSGSTFLPGGDGIGITSVKSPGVGSSFPGRVSLLTGSTTLIKVDFVNPQTNTIVESQSQGFGPNTAAKAYDGCTILVTNINTGAGQFAAGQNFRMFRNSDTAVPNLNIGNAGLNTTNRYPIIQPIIPAANTKWDVASLIDPDPNGFVNVISFPTSGTNVAYSTFVADGTNQVSHLQWPSDYIGWSLQQQTNSLSVGLTTNSWTTVAGSSATNEVYITNSISTPAAFFRMIYP